MHHWLTIRHTHVRMRLYPCVIKMLCFADFESIQYHFMAFEYHILVSFENARGGHNIEIKNKTTGRSEG